MFTAESFGRYVKKNGIYKTALAVTLIAIATSVVITFLSMTMGGTYNARGLVVAVIVPSIICPFIGIIFLRVLFERYKVEENLSRLAVTDNLTDVYNRRYFLEAAELELERAKRFGNIFSMILLDIDNLRRINDDYGNGGGDLVLIAVGKVCLHHCRKIDIFARYEDDEFIFLLPECGKEEALAFAERIRSALAEIRVEYRANSIRFSASLGVQTYSGLEDSLENIMARIDHAMYAAKNAGKNRVSVQGLPTA